jgi:hypothetical protein
MSSYRLCGDRLWRIDAGYRVNGIPQTLDVKLHVLLDLQLIYTLRQSMQAIGLAANSHVCSGLFCPQSQQRVSDDSPPAMEGESDGRGVSENRVSPPVVI